MRKSYEFDKVFSEGVRRSNPWTTLIIARSNPLDFSRGKQPQTRIGVSASRKLGGAVERNRAKRRIREILRLNLERLEKGLDIVAIPRPAVLRADYQELKISLEELLRPYFLKS